jgi:hypothetical protein
MLFFCREISCGACLYYELNITYIIYCHFHKWQINQYLALSNNLVRLSLWLGLEDRLEEVIKHVIATED